MCLLLTGKSSVVRSALLDTAGLIEDIYQSNADGLGVMYATTDGLKVKKTLPKSALDARKFIEKIPVDDREVALHFRWRTHGDINLEQCHPYTISEGVAMMHNGILHTGNKADESKSDTWHFIEDYLKTLSADALHDPKLGAMIGDFIEGNKFAIMSGDGRLTVINKDQGVEYGGVWYSNTYAWSPELVDPSYRKKYVSPVRGYNGYAGSYNGYVAGRLDADWDDEDDTGYAGFEVQARGAVGAKPRMVLTDDAAESLEIVVAESDVESLAEYFDEAPQATLSFLFDNYTFAPYAKTTDSDLGLPHINIRKELVAGEEAKLLDRLERDMAGSACELIAETLLWHCDVHPRAQAEPAAQMQTGQIAMLLS